MIERTQELPESWDLEVDLLVAGSGAAGLTTALVGALEGLNVTLIEKTAVIGGTTSMSGGGVWIPLNDHMAEEGVEDSREEVLEYLRACTGAAGEEEMLEALVDHGAEAIRYLERRSGLFFRSWPAIGGASDYRPWLPGSRAGARTLDPGRFELARLGEWVGRLRNLRPAVGDKLDYYRKRAHLQPPGDTGGIAGRSPLDRRERETSPEFTDSGAALIAQLLHACLEAGVNVLTATPAKELLLAGGRVIGVRAEQDGAPFFVAARHGVALATGGYSHNEALKRAWMNRPLELSCEIAENQGDGHLMGIAIGAQVAHLGDAWWYPWTPLTEAASGPQDILSTRDIRTLPHSLMVNGRGRRFFNEMTNYNDWGDAFGTKSDGPRNLPAWYVFDSQGVARYAALDVIVPDNGAEFPAWLKRAQTLAELAAEIDVDADAFVASVERFNEHARRGEDPDFGRGQNPWDIRWGDPDNTPNPGLGTVEVGPFFALPVRPGSLATKGGLQINTNGEVRSALTDAPIPGLFAAGNCASSATPGAYPGAGTTLGAAVTFGYLIAHRVAALAATGATAGAS